MNRRFNIGKAVNHTITPQMQMGAAMAAHFGTGDYGLLALSGMHYGIQWALTFPDLAQRWLAFVQADPSAPRPDMLHSEEVAGLNAIITAFLPQEAPDAPRNSDSPEPQ